MAEESRAGQAEPDGEVVAAPEEPVVQPAAEQDDEIRLIASDNNPPGSWPVTGEDEIAEEEEPDQSTGDDEQEPEPIAPTAEAAPPAQPALDWERLFKGAMEYIQATRQPASTPSGQPGAAQPGQWPNQSPTGSVPGLMHEAVAPPDSIESIAAENNTTVDDPLVQRIHRQSQELYQTRLAQQQALQPLVADYQQRQADVANWNAYSTWVATQCPPDKRPATADEHQQVFMDFTRIAAGRYMSFAELMAIREFESQQKTKPIKQARQEGYEQALRHKEKATAANVTSGKPTTRKVELPPARNFREQWKRDNPGRVKR